MKRAKTPDSGENARAAGALPPSGFELRLAEGRAFVEAGGRPLGEGVSVRRFSMEIPAVRFPFDVTGGADRFRDQRCVLRELELVVEASTLERWIPAALDLGPLGIEQMSAAIRPGCIELAGEHGAAGPFTVKVGIEAEGTGLSLLFYELRLYRPAPLCSALLLHRLAGSARGEEDPLAPLPGSISSGPMGSAKLRCDPLPALLRQLLVSRGYKLPDARLLKLSSIELSSGHAVLGFLAAGAASPGGLDHLTALEGARTYAEIERLIAEGELTAARSELLAISSTGSPHPFAAERLLQLLAADPAAHDMALDICAMWRDREPPLAAATWIEACLRQAQGDPRRAGTLFCDLAERALTGRELFSAGAAASAAATLALQVQDDVLAQRALALQQAARPEDLEVLTGVAEVAERRGDLPAALSALRRVAAFGGDGERAALAHARLGRLLLKESRDLPRARLHLDRALQLRPNDRESLLALAEACERGGEELRALRLLERAQQLAERDSDGELSARLSLRAARLWEERIRHPENALLRYRDAMSALNSAGAESGLYLEAASGMASLCEKLGLWPEAMEAHLALADRSAPGRPRAQAKLALSRLLSRHLADPAAADRSARAALAEDPSYSEAAAELCRLRRDGPPGPFCEALALAAQLAPVADVRAALLSELGRVQLRQLHNAVAASTSFEDALRALPGFKPAIEGAVEAAEEQGLGAAMAAALERLVPQLPAGSDRQTALRRLADCYDRLGNFDRAAEVLAEAATDAEVPIEVLERLLSLQRRRGDVGAATDLAKRLAAALSTRGDRDAATGVLLVQLEAVARESPDEALASELLDEARRNTPDDLRVLRWEVQLARRKGDAEITRAALLRLLGAVGNDDGPSALAAAQRQLGEACAELGKLEEAVAAFEKSFELEPSELAADQLAGLYRRLGRQAERATALERLAGLLDLHDRPAAAQWFEAAEIVRETEPDRAVQDLKNAVAAGGGLAAEAQRSLGRLYQEQGRLQEAADALEAWADLHEDAHERALGLREAARVGGDETRVERLVRQAALADPSDPWSAGLVPSFDLAAGDAEGALAAAEHALDLGTLEAEAAEVCEAIAAEAASQLGRSQQELLHVQRLVESQPDELHWLRRRAELLRATPGEADALELLAARLRGHEAAAVLCELGALHQEAGDGDAAAEAYLRALVHAPEDRAALTGAVQSVPRDPTDRRIDLLERYLEHVNPAGGPELAELAELLEPVDAARALDCWRRAAEADPTEPSVADRQAGLLERLERWAEAAEVRQGAADRLRDRGEAGWAEDELRAAVGFLRAARYGDAAAAAERGLAAGDDSLAPTLWRTLAEARHGEGDAVAEARALAEAGTRVPLSERGVLARRRADLLLGLGDRDAEREALLQGLSASPRDLALLVRLKEACLALDDVDGACDALDILIQAALPDRSAAAAAALELGILAQDRLGKSLRAEAAFRKALGLDPSQRGALGRLGELRLSTGETRDGLQLLSRSIDLEPDREVAAAARVALGRRAISLLDDELALAEARTALIRSPDFLPAVRLAAELLYLAGATTEALPLLERLVAQDWQEEPEELERLSLWLAETQAAIGDPNAARATLERLVGERPGSEAARERLADLYAELPEEVAIERWVSLADGAATPRLRADLLGRAGRRLLPASPELAAKLLQRAAGEVDSAGLRAELRRALEAAGDFEALSDAWVREVEQARDDEDATIEETALRALAIERRRAEDPEGRALVLDELADLLGKDPSRASEAGTAFAEAAALWESEGSLPQALEDYRRSLALAESAEVRARAVATCRSLDRPADLAALLEGGLAGMPEVQRAQAILELADLRGGVLAEPDKVEAALWQAHELVPDLEGLEERLRSLLSREGRRVELAAFLVSSAERAERLDREAEAGRLFAAAAEELLTIGDNDGAAAAMASSARHQPSPERLLRAADLRYEAGEVAAAGELYGLLLEQAPVGAPRRVLERRAEALRAKGDAEPLATFLERAAEAGPTPAAWLAEAAAAWERVEATANGEAAERAMRARQRCERLAFEADPADPRLFAAVIGSVAAADPDEWARLLRLRAAAIPTEAPSLQRTLGEVFWTARRMEEAAKAYDAALAADPADLLALVGRAEVAFATGEPLTALAERLREALRSGTERRPEHAEAAFRMGALLGQEGTFALSADLLEQAIELSPGSHHTAEALQLLDAAVTALGDRPRQIDARLRRWRAVKPEARLEVLQSLLEVLDDDHPAAVSALREAYAIEPAVEVAERLATALDLAGDWAGLAAHLEGLASGGGDAVEDLVRRHGWALAGADVYAGRLANGPAAERLRGLAIELGEGSPQLLRKTVIACEGGPPELLDRALVALAACVADEERGELSLRRAHLADASFGPTQRRNAWAAVLEGGIGAPGRGEALERQLDFEAEDGRPQDAIKTLLQLVETTEGPSARASRLQQAAKLAEEDLEDSPRAIELLRRAAEEAGDARAYTLLAEACDRAGKTAEAAAAMIIEVSRREPGERKRERQRKLGLMLARDLNRPTEALEHLKAAWEGSDADPQLLEELAFCAGKLGDAELELSALEALPADAPGSAARARRKATLLEGLGRPAEATDAWRRAFLLDANDGPTFDALVRQLEIRKGWEELSDVLRRRVEALQPAGEESRPARADLLAKRAALLAGELGDTAGGEAAYREALEAAPGHRASLAALAALCQARGASAEAADLLALELQGEESALTRATLGLRLGRLRQELGDAGRAEKALRDALDSARAADSKPLVGEIQGSMATSLLLLDRPEEALVCAKAAISTAPPGELGRLHALCADAAARLGLAEQAAEHWRALLELHPGDASALAGLEGLARSQGPAQLAKALQERASVDPDAMHKTRLLLEAADLYLTRLDDAMSGETALRAAVEAAPDEGEAFVRLRKLLDAQGRNEELAEALRLRARRSTSEETRAESLRDQGEILRTRLRDPRRAAEAYTRSLELRPADAVAAEGLAECLLSLGQGDRASEYYRRALAGGGHLGEFFLHYRLGEIAQRAERPEQALESYQQSIAANPSFLPAREAAAQVADALGRVDVAIAVLRGVLGVLDPAEFGDQVAGVLLRIGELEKRSLHFEAAIEAFERSAELAPNDPRPLQDLAVLYQHRARWPDAIRVLLRLSELSEGAPAATALVEAAVLSLDKIADMAKAADLLERAIAIEPPDERALQRLAEISAALGRHDRLVNIADRVGALTPAGGPPWLEELWVPLAAAFEAVGRIPDAHEAIVRARRGAPGLEVLMERQRALAEKAGLVPEQLDLEEQIIELVSPRRRLEAATRLRALARRAVETHQEFDRGERLLERAEELAPARPEDRRLLADLRRRHPESASRAAAGYLELVRGKWPPPLDLLRALGTTAASVGESDLTRSALGLAGAMAGEPPPLPPTPRMLPESVWRSLPFPSDAPIGVLLHELAPFLEPLFPADLRRFGLAPADRLGPGRAPQVQRWVEEARSSLRARTVQVFLVPGLDGVTLENTLPHALIVGGGPLATLGPGPMQFLIAHRLALVELGFTLPLKFSMRDIGTLAMLLACFLADPGMAPEAEAVRLQPFLTALAETCPAPLRQRHAATGKLLAESLPHFDARRCLSEAMLRAAKVALWCTGDLAGALAALGFLDASEATRGLPSWETPLGQALTRWAFSAEYLSLRAEQGEPQVDPQAGE